MCSKSHAPQALKMRPWRSFQLMALVILLVATQIHDQSAQRLDRLSRRQSGDGQQESTTAASTSATAAGQRPEAQQPGRLYPDLPQQPNFIPPFNAPTGNGFNPSPLVPFGMVMPPPTGRLNADQQPVPFGRMPQQPRQLTPAERLQSQSFANGLGRRLLSMIGINVADKPQVEREAQASSGQAAPGQEQQEDEAAKALRNATVLQQLNKGLNSIYGGLSKVYNSTIQEQLVMLQERFKKETENSTNPWHQRVAQTVPMFFKQVAGKVGEAQDQLNRVWRDIASANASGTDASSVNITGGRPRSFFGSFDQFVNQGDFSFGGDVFNQFGRSLGFNTDAQSQQQQNETQQMSAQAMSARVKELWATQVQPQINFVRGQVARAWRDLTASGAFNPEIMFRSRANTDLGATKNSSTDDLVDSILKEVDMGASEYSLVEPKSDGGSESSGSEGGDQAKSNQRASADQQSSTGIKLSPQMQNKLLETQRELIKVWMGLTNSLQGAIANVQRTLNPRAPFATSDTMGGPNQAESNRQQEQANPALNEIDGTLKNLARLQRDADMVHEAVQQQQRDAQQRQTFADRFRGFFNQVNMNAVNQLPDRIGEQFNRFGNAMGNFWNQIPNRWDNFMTQVKPQIPPQAQ